MRKRILVILLAVAALLCAGAYAGIHHYQSTRVVLGEQVYSRDITELDLSGTKNLDVEQLCTFTALKSLNLRDTGLTAAEYETLREALPECEIQWLLPFQGAYLELDTRELTISYLNQGDLESLKYLPELETVHAEECGNLDMLMTLRERYPGVTVSYIVPIDGRSIAWDVSELMIVGPDPAEVDRMLAYLPNLQKLVLTGAHPGNEVLWELEKAHPEVKIVWNVDVLGKNCLNTSQEIDISGVKVQDLADIEAVLQYFPDLEKLIMCDCGKTSEELAAFQDKHPELKIVWSVKIRFFYVRTDAKYLMPYQYGCTGLSNSDVNALKYLTELECIDLGHMGINDLSFLYSMPNVKYLIIADCDIRDITPVGSLKKLEYLEMFVNKVQDISPLAQCTELRDINMCYNWVSDFAPLLELEHLEHLWAKGNSFTWEQRQALEQAFPDAKIVIYSANISSTSDGWRKIPRYYEQRDFMGMWYTTEN